MPRPLIEVQNIAKHYQGSERSAVSDLSFTLNQGEILALLGPNGAGKTTTIKMILGLITPSSGTAYIMGHNMAVEKERRVGVRHVGVVLEGARNAYWRLSARENLLYFGRLRGLTTQQVNKRADELLQLLGLTQDAHKELRLFSRGMQQKLAIAIAMLHDPDVLLLDEPTLGLDVQAAKVLEQTIIKLTQVGKAVLLTTHMMGVAERLSHRILVIKNGRTIAHDQTKNLLKQFNIRTTVDVVVQGQISVEIRHQIEDHFPSIVMTVENGETALTWLEPEQHQIVSLYNLLDQNNLTVTHINRREAKLEEVFLSLIEESD